MRSIDRFSCGPITAANVGTAAGKRVVTEVRRGVTDRDEYEAVSREIRFKAYAQAYVRPYSDYTRSFVRYAVKIRSCSL